MPATQIPLRTRKPIWWRLIVGSLLLFVTIDNRIHPAPNLLKADNAAQQFGMDAFAITSVIVGIWLLFTGIRPQWRKISN